MAVVRWWRLSAAKCAVVLGVLLLLAGLMEVADCSRTHRTVVRKRTGTPGTTRIRSPTEVAFEESGLMATPLTLSMHHELLKIQRALVRWQGDLLDFRKALVAERTATPAGGGSGTLGTVGRFEIADMGELADFCRATSNEALVYPFVLTDGLGHSLMSTVQVLLSVLGANCTTMAPPTVRFGVAFQMLFVPWRFGLRATPGRSHGHGESLDDSDAALFNPATGFNADVFQLASRERARGPHHLDEFARFQSDHNGSEVCMLCRYVIYARVHVSDCFRQHEHFFAALETGKPIRAWPNV